MEKIIFKAIEEVSALTDANIGINFESLKNTIRRATDKWVKPAIGNALYNVAVNAYDTGTPLAILNNLIYTVQKAVAPLAILLYIPRAEAQITDGGLRRGTSEQLPGAYKYQVQEILKSYLDDGLTALENLCSFVEENVSSFPEWANSEQRAGYNRLLIRNGAELNRFYTFPRPQLTYQALNAPLALIDDLVMPNLFGDTYTELKAKQVTDMLTFDEKILIGLIKKATAYLAVAKGLPQLSLQIDDNGVTILGSAADNTLGAESKRSAAEAQAISTLAQSCETTGGEYIKEATAYLNKKASATIFPSWFATKGNIQTVPDLNTSGTGIFSM